MRDRKSQLIDSAIDYLLQNGLAGLSLRPLAAGVGTSARLLIFHFGSKEGLVGEVLTDVQERMRKSLAAIASSKSSLPGETPMKRCWRWASDKRNLPCLRLLYEAHFIAVRTPGTYERYLNQSSLNWIEFIASRLPESISSAAMATLCGAVFDGLIIELLSTGDLRRTTRALDDFIALLQREHEARTRAARLDERARKARSRT